MTEDINIVRNDSYTQYVTVVQILQKDSKKNLTPMKKTTDYYIVLT